MEVRVQITVVVLDIEGDIASFSGWALSGVVQRKVQICFLLLHLIGMAFEFEVLIILQ